MKKKNEEKAIKEKKIVYERLSIKLKELTKENKELRDIYYEKHGKREVLSISNNDKLPDELSKVKEDLSRIENESNAEIYKLRNFIELCKNKLREQKLVSLLCT